MQLDNLRMEMTAQNKASTSELAMRENECKDLQDSVAVLERQLKFLNKSDEVAVMNGENRLMKKAGISGEPTARNSLSEGSAPGHSYRPPLGCILTCDRVQGGGNLCFYDV